MKPFDLEAAKPVSYVQVVPDHCDRITWRKRYYHLPIEQQPTTPPGYVSIPQSADGAAAMVGVGMAWLEQWKESYEEKKNETV